MIKVGITGGIGSGKSHICKIAESLYVPVFYTDDISKEIVANDLEVRSYILESYGSEAYVDDKPNSKFLSDILFNDDTEMAKLVDKVSPKLVKKMNEWFDKNESSKIVFVESAIMLNTSFGRDNLDKIVCVIADMDVRVERVLKRDTHRTYEDVLTIINKQLSNDIMITGKANK